MRKLKIMEHISLDGVIEHSSSAGGSGFPYGDWTGPYRTPAGLAKVLEKYGETFDVVLGRRTYDQFSSFWPTAPKSPMADRLNAAKKYVVTHRPESLAWGPFEGIGADVVEDVRRVKASDGPNIVVTGSSSLTSTLIENGLADEMVLMVNPVLLGTGKRLFSEGTQARSFELISTSATPTGIVVNEYKFVGTLKNLS